MTRSCWARPLLEKLNEHARQGGTMAEAREAYKFETWSAEDRNHRAGSASNDDLGASRGPRPRIGPGPAETRGRSRDLSRAPAAAAAHNVGRHTAVLQRTRQKAGTGAANFRATLSCSKAGAPDAEGLSREPHHPLDCPQPAGPPALETTDREVGCPPSRPRRLPM